jgi:hypothetical protein
MIVADYSVGVKDFIAACNKTVRPGDQLFSV